MANTLIKLGTSQIETFVDPIILELLPPERSGVVKHNIYFDRL